MSSNQNKRGTTNRSNNNIKRKSNQSYFIDRAFLPRVKEYLEIQQDSIDEDDVVEYLQTRYHEYSRKKRNVLRLSVVKAIDTLSIKKNHVPEDDATSELEKRYLRKRQKRSKSLEGKELEVNSDETSDATDEELVFYKDTNAMNNSMQNLYKTQSLTQSVNTKVEDKQASNDEAKGDSQQSLSREEQKLRRPPINDVAKSKSENVITPKVDSNKTLKETPATFPLIRKGLMTISEDEKSITSSRPNTPLSKSSKSRTGERTKDKSKKFEPTSSTVTFKDIGGYDSCIKEISKLILHLKHPEVFAHLGIKPPRGFLLHGAPGCGKTLLANAIAGELKVPFYKVAAPEVVSGISGESEQKIRSLFNEARLAAPSIIFIDEIDSITPKRENAGKEMERRVVTQILSCMDELSNIDSHVLVIGATNRVDSLDPALRRAGRFDREIAMGIPDRAARQSILQVICQKLRLESEFSFEKIASCTPGFVGADIQALAREAAIHAVDCAFQNLREKEKVAVKLFVEEQVEGSPMVTSNLKTLAQTSSELDDSTSTTSWLRDQPPLTNDQLKGLFITTEHFEKALSSVQPSAKREGFATVPDVTWDDIGALEDVREELTMAIMAPVQNPEEFEALGLSTPPGILLAGPPGCGKTLLAKAIANEAGINFISVKGPELLNMYVGESEKAVRQVFVRARNSSPCVIFFDEIDALCPRRSQTGDSNVSSRVVNQLLTEMDGLEARKQVFIMGATNRPDILDGAIMRPGRLDKLLYVGLPNVTDRFKILQTITKNGTKPRCSCDVSMEILAADVRCDGYSGADLSAFVREASVAALKEFMAQRKAMETMETDTAVNVSDGAATRNPTKGLSDPKEIHVTSKHFEIAFEKVKPSVLGKDRKWYDEMKEKHIKK